MISVFPPKGNPFRTLLFLFLIAGTIFQSACTFGFPRKGIVLDKTTGTPVDSAMILIYPPNIAKQYPDVVPVLTGEDGSFSISAPLPGDLLFSVEKYGYTSFTTGIEKGVDTIYLSKSTP